MTISSKREVIGADFDVNAALKAAPGINVHKGNLRVQFKLPDAPVAVKRSLGYPLTEQNLKLAKDTLNAIKTDIANRLYHNDPDEFWRKHFPTAQHQSKRTITVIQAFQQYQNENSGTISDSEASKLRTTSNWLVHYKLANKPICAITARELNELRNKTTNGNKNGKFKGCRVSSVREYSNTFSRVLDYFVSIQYLSDNPFKNVRKLVSDDNLEVQDRIVRPFSQAELAALLEVVHVPQTKQMIRLLAWTGMRHGELKALAWEDIDFKRKTLTVRYNLTRKGKLKSPKSKSGYREFELLPEALKVLQEMKLQTFLMPQHEDIIHFKHGKTKSVMRRRVFLSRENLPYKRPELTTVSNQWHKWLTKAEITARPAYQLRHTFASQLVTVGVNLSWLANAMGHADTGMINKIYGKFIPRENPDYVDMIAGRLGQFY